VTGVGIISMRRFACIRRVLVTTTRTARDAYVNH
jgi:hypothetical protein